MKKIIALALLASIAAPTVAVAREKYVPPSCALFPWMNVCSPR